MEWQIQEAKQRFSELVRHAEADGPQVVTRHGRKVVVVLAAEEYTRLQAGVPDFKDFLASPPDLALLDIRRNEGMARTVDLPPASTAPDR